MLEFTACHLPEEESTDLVFNSSDDGARRNRVIRTIVEPLGHSVVFEGMGQSVAAGGEMVEGDTVTVQPPLGLSTLIAISSNLSANMAVTNGYPERGSVGG